MKAKFQLKNYILPLLFIVLSIKSYSKNVDSLIFNNDFEKKVFARYINGEKVDPLDVFIAPNYNSNSLAIKELLNTIYNSLDELGIKELSKKKQIKTIYKRIFDQYLKRYSEEAVFSDIFKDGSFNCISASGLYSIIFEHYNIDYLIKKTSVHVYVIADPNGEKIAIETALQTNGNITIDEKLKRNFVDHLKGNKLISDFDYYTKTLEKLFEINYNNANSISLLQLAALQYFNWGVIYFNSFVYSDALKNMEKADILIHNDQITFLKIVTLNNLLVEESSNKKYSGKNLAKFLNENYKNSEVVNLAKEYFYLISSELTINQPNIVAFKLYFSEFTSYISDSIPISDFINIYNNLFGNYYYNLKDFKRALHYLDVSYKLNSEYINTMQLISKIIENYVCISELQIDSESMVDSIESNFTKYPFLKENSNIIIHLIGFYNSTINSYIELGQFEKVDLLIERIERSINSFSLERNEEIIKCLIYQQIVITFANIQQFDKSENYLLKGLALYPKSGLLLFSQRILQEQKAKYKNLQRATLGLDTETYSVLSTLANNRKTIINNNINQYLRNFHWRLEYYIYQNKIKKLPKKEQVTLIFEENSIVKIGNYTGEIIGKWSYNKSDNILKIFDNKENLILKFMVYEFDSTMIKAVRYFENNYRLMTFLKKID